MQACLAPGVGEGEEGAGEVVSEDCACEGCYECGGGAEAGFVCILEADTEVGEASAGAGGGCGCAGGLGVVVVVSEDGD